MTCCRIGVVAGTVIGLTALAASRGQLVTLAAATLAPPQQFASGFVLVSVTDSGGRPVVDLDPDDFVVREGEQPLDVLSARVADYPIAVVIDNSPAAGRELDAIRRATIRFIGRLGRRPIAIATANPPRIVASFDDDRATLIKRVDTLRKNGSGDGIFQAVLVAAEANRATGAPFTAVVVIVASVGGAVPSGFLTSVLDSGTHVHIVVEQKAVSNGPRPARQQSLQALSSLVDDTGGQLTAIYSPDSFPVAMDRLASYLAGELMVEYLVPPGSPGGRNVQLGVRRSGVRVLRAPQR